MYDARAVSNFFLDRASAERRGISAMSLLKILYFAQSWHLAKYDRPLIAQPFEAWQHGPVCRVVYDQIKKSGKNNISKRLVSFSVLGGGFIETRCDFDSETTELLRNVFDYYSRFHPFHLSDLTHEAGSPWDKIWKEAEKRAVPGMVIPNDLIKDWFRASRGLLAASGQKGTLS